MAETLIFPTGTFVLDGVLTSTASISQLNLDGVSGSFTGSFTGTLTGSVTGAVAVLSDPWQRTTGSVAGAFNANLFTLGELAQRTAGVIDELLVFVPPPLTLPQLSSLTLHYDAREQGDISIIQEIINGRDAAASSGTFTFRQNPPSVDLFIGLNAVNNGMPISLMHNSDGIMTMMALVNPGLISATRVVTSFGGRTRFLLGTPSNSHWGFDMGETSGDDSNAGTQIPATQSVWQTVCYTVDVDGPNKQTGYFNGVQAIGPLSKSFDVAQFSLPMGIGNSSYSGSFGAYVHWTTPLSAAEVAQAHNFLRNIDAAYGLPEAII